jgi:hypothetical protein
MEYESDVAVVEVAYLFEDGVVFGFFGGGGGEAGGEGEAVFCAIYAVGGEF